MLSLELILILGLLFTLVVCCMLATLLGPGHLEIAEKKLDAAKPEEAKVQTVKAEVGHWTE